jgi:hypothetical protein
MNFPVMAGAIYFHAVVWKNSPKNAVIVLASAIATVVLWALL